jgi:hypothetical protein
MNKTNLIWGIICLVIAGGLAIANLTLPPESLMFQIGKTNMPWVPPVVLGIVGIILLATAGIGGQSEATPAPLPKLEVIQDPEKAAMNKRLESIAWGSFLIMWAGSMFVSKIWNQVPDGVWSIGIGAIMLGLNVARYFNKIKMSGFTTVLGIISVIGGVIQLFGVKDLEGAFLLLILGAYLILKPWFDHRQLFGKAESR